MTIDNQLHRYRLGIVGNCSYIAYIDDRAAVRWLCMPRFDSSFLFGSLLDPDKGGDFSIQPTGPSATRQSYIENTNILCTEIQGRRWLVQGHGFRAAVLPVRPVLPPADADPQDRAPSGTAQNYGQVCAGGRLRPNPAGDRARQQPHPIPEPRRSRSPDDGYFAELHSRRQAFRAERPPIPALQLRSAAGSPAGGHRGRLPGQDPPVLAAMGQNHLYRPHLPGADHPLRPRAQAPSIRGYRRHHRRGHHEPA